MTLQVKKNAIKRDMTTFFQFIILFNLRTNNITATRHKPILHDNQTEHHLTQLF
jgi:hypothetical protein